MGASHASASSNAAPNRQQMSALHARFGEGAAKARVDRAKALDKAERARKKAEKELKLEQQLEDDIVAEETRKQCAQRAASARRAREEAQRKEAELKQQQERAREANQE